MLSTILNPKDAKQYILNPKPYTRALLLLLTMLPIQPRGVRSGDEEPAAAAAAAAAARCLVALGIKKCDIPRRGYLT
jgi:hypothetical protein